MRRNCICGTAVLACTLAAWSLTTRPAGMGSGEDLPSRIHEAVRELPSLDAPAVTPEQQSRGKEACALYRAGLGQLEKLGGIARMKLAFVGAHGGFAAGDAKVMLSGARLLQNEARGSKWEEYAAYTLAWAGLFAGQREPAEAALKHLMANPSQRKLAGLAERLLPIARQCHQRIEFNLAMLDGKRLPGSELRGKAVVLEFGAGAVEPWRNALPALKEFYAARKADEHFVMIGLNLDESVEEATKAVRAHQVPWRVGLGRKLRQRFRGEGVPHLAVLSADGRVLWQGHPLDRGIPELVTDFARRQARYLAEHPEAAATGPAPQESASAEAEKKYKLAVVYRDAGMTAKAKAVLTEIVKTYPGTPAAAKARALLESLP